VHPDLVPVLEALQRPDRELAMRLVTPDGIARVSVARRGTLCVLVRRINDDIILRVIGHGVELSAVTTALLAELPRAKPADIPPVGAPLSDISESLSGTNHSVELADRIRLLGIESQAAMMLGSALASRQAFVEIVYYTLADAEDRISRGPAAVAVLYTKRGRIVAAPSASPAGQVWTTFKAGSDHAIGQAVAQLIELADEKWGDS
jgi:EspG family